MEAGDGDEELHSVAYDPLYSGHKLITMVPSPPSVVILAPVTFIIVVVTQQTLSLHCYKGLVYVP